MNVTDMDETVQTPDTGEHAATDTATSPAEKLKEDVIAAIRECYDPEIPVNIYDLGLIYDVHVSDTSKVDLVMTLFQKKTNELIHSILTIVLQFSIFTIKIK